MENVFKHLKMNLQHFAEDPQDTPPADQQSAGETDPVTLTPEELQSKIDAESERRLQKVLQKKQKEWEELMEDRIRQAKEEGESYAQMTEKQRQDAELKRQMEEFQKERSEFEKQKLTIEVQSDLIDKGLPKELAPALVALEDKQVISETVNSIQEVWKEQLNEAVKETLRQETPVDGVNKVKSKVNKFAEERNKRKAEKQQGPNPWA